MKFLSPDKMIKQIELLGLKIDYDGGINLEKIFLMKDKLSKMFIGINSDKDTILFCSKKVFYQTIKAVEKKVKYKLFQ